MRFEYEDDDDHQVGPLLPPEDRLWRHPSELGSAAETSARVDSPQRLRTAGSRRVGPVVVGAVLAGALLTLGVVGLVRVAAPEPKPAEPLRTASPAGNQRSAVAPNGPSAPGNPRSMTVANKEFNHAAGDPGAIAELMVVRPGSKQIISGFWLDHRGTLVTAANAVAGAAEIVLLKGSGRASRARLLGTDATTGVAVLAVDHTNSNPAVLAGRRPVTGSTVRVVGADADSATTSTDLSVASLGSTSTASTINGRVLHDTLRLDVALPPWFRGAPVYGPNDTVIGMLLGTDDTGSSAVVPTDQLVGAAEDLISN